MFWGPNWIHVPPCSFQLSHISNKPWTGSLLLRENKVTLADPTADCFLLENATASSFSISALTQVPYFWTRSYWEKKNVSILLGIYVNMSTALSHSSLMPVPSEFKKLKQGLTFWNEGHVSSQGRQPEPGAAERERKWSCGGEHLNPLRVRGSSPTFPSPLSHRNKGGVIFPGHTACCHSFPPSL